jgi:hypothetical protein
VDDVGLRALDQFRFDYGGEEDGIIFGTEVHYANEQELPHDELTRLCTLQGAHMSKAQRIVAARTPQTLFVNIPLFFTKKKSDHWHEYALQRLTRFTAYFRNISYLVQSDPFGAGIANNALCQAPVPVGSTTYLLNHWLRFEVSTPSTATKNAFMALIASAGKTGWNYLFKDVQRLTDITIPAGTTNWTYIMNTFTRYTYNLRFMIRPWANLQPNFLNNECWKLVDLSEFSFDMGGQQYQQVLDDFYEKHALIGKYYLGNERLPIYNIFFTDYPDVATDGLGGIEMSGVVNPTIHISFPVALPYDCNIEFIASTHNYVRMIIDGASTAVETVLPILN